MADRFYVGGTANWDGTAGTKWATTSGGAGGASVPTTSDNAIFDANSGTVTVTISAGNTGCLNLICTGFTGTLAGSAAITVAGSLTFASSMAAITYSGVMTMSATTSQTMTFGGESATTVDFTFDGVGGTWTLQDAMSADDVILTNGTFDANDFNVDIDTFSSSNSNTRTISMGSGTWSLRGTGTVWTTSTTTNLTFNAETSTLNLVTNTASARTVTGGGVTFNNVGVTAGSGNITFTSTFNCNNLDFTGQAGALQSSTINISGNLTLGTGMTVSNGPSTISMVATSGTKTITSNGVSISRPITINTSVGVTVQPTDTFLQIGDRALTLTQGIFNLNGQNVTVGSFSSGSSNTRQLTLGAVDIKVGDTNGIVWNTADDTGLTISTSGGGIDFIANTANTRTVSSDATLTLPTIKLSAGTGTYSFSLVVTNSLIATGSTGNLDIAGAGSSVTLGANYARGGTLTLTNGTFNANNFAVSVAAFSSNNSNTRVLTMGSGTWTLTGTGTVWTTATTTGLTFNTNTSTIVVNDASASSKTFAGGGLTYNAVQFTGAGTGTFIISGSNTFGTFTIDTPPHTLQITASTTQTFTNAPVLSGTSGNLTTIESTSAGTAYTFRKTAGNVSENFLSLRDCVATGGARWFAGKNSTNVSGNNGWRFATSYSGVPGAGLDIPTLL